MQRDGITKSWSKQVPGIQAEVVGMGWVLQHTVAGQGADGRHLRTPALELAQTWGTLSLGWGQSSEVRPSHAVSPQAQYLWCSGYSTRPS